MRRVKKILVLLLVLSMVLSQSVTAFAEENPAENEKEAAETIACTRAEGCTLEDGHEGECVVGADDESRANENAVGKDGDIGEEETKEKIEIPEKTDSEDIAVISTEELDAAVPVPLSANGEAEASGDCGENAHWKVTSNGDGTYTLTIYGSGKMENYTNTDGVINYPWSSYCEQITEVSVLDGITQVGDNAFFKFPNLKKADLSEDIIEIGASAFYGCSSLSEVNLNNGLQRIGEYAFAAESSSALQSITLPESVTYIGKYAFLRTEIASVVLPKGMVSISEGTFKFCTKLQTITAENVTEVLVSAFDGCSALTDISASKITTFGNRAFANCSSLKGIVIAEGTDSIGNYAFTGCTSLESIVIPDTVTTIGREAFSKCSSLDKVTMPGTVSTMYKDTFTNPADFILTGSGAIEAHSSTTWSTGIWTLNQAALKTIVIEEGITELGENVFRGCTTLTSIRLPQTLQKIGSYAFMADTGLTVIDLSKAAEDLEIGTRIFEQNSVDFIVYVSNETTVAVLKSSVTNANTKKRIILANTNGGSFSEHIVLNTEKLAVPFKLGYQFEGWYDNESYAGDKVENAVAGTTYYAKWTQNTDAPVITSAQAEKIYLNLGDTVTLTVTSYSQITNAACSSPALQYKEAVNNYDGTWTVTFEVVKITGNGASMKFTVENANGESEEYEAGWYNLRNKVTVAVYESNGAPITDAEVILNHQYVSAQSITLSSKGDGTYQAGESSVSNGDYDAVKITLPDGRTAVINQMNGEALASVIKAGETPIVLEYTFPGYTVTGKLYLNGVYQTKADGTSAYANSVRGVYGTAIDYSGMKAWMEAQALELDGENTPVSAVATVYKDGGTYQPEKTFGESKKITNYVMVNVVTSYGVTFDSQGGSEIAKQVVEYNKTASKPENPAKDGYSFKGWYTDSSCTDGNEYSFDAAVTKSITLYAKWVDDIAPTFTLENTSGSPAAERTVTLKASEPIKSPGEGWSEVEGSNGTQWTKTFTQNTKIKDFTVTDLAGNQSEPQVLDVKNVDSSVPSGSVSYSTTAPTNQNVVVTLTTSTDCETPEGWTKVNWKTFTKEYTENAEEEVSLISRTGIPGEVKAVVSVQNIDRIAPEVSGLEDGKTYCGAAAVTVKDTSGIASVTVNGEAVTLENGGFTMIPAEGGQIVIVTDNAGNTTTITVTVNDGHTSDGGVVTKAATATAAGEKTYTCTVCGEVIKVEKIPATGTGSSGSSSGSHHSSDSGSKSTTAVTVQSVKTGDSSMASLWLTLCGIAAAGAAVLLLFTRKRRSGAGH